MTKKKGPGQNYRKGLSLPQLIRQFPDNAAAEAWFAAVRWPDGPQCPHCASAQYPERAQRTRCPTAAALAASGLVSALIPL